MRLAFLMLAALPACAQRVSFESLVHSCIPGADPVDVGSIVRTESAFHPLALSIDYPKGTALRWGFRNAQAELMRQPQTFEQAVNWANRLLHSGLSVSVGLMQVQSRSYPGPVSELFQPCRNLSVGWSRFSSYYRIAASRVGPGPVAIRQALTAYNGGGRDYAATVLRNFQSIK